MDVPKEYRSYFAIFVEAFQNPGLGLRARCKPMKKHNLSAMEETFVATIQHANNPGRKLSPVVLRDSYLMWFKFAGES